jgi:hypothetical protein
MLVPVLEQAGVIKAPINSVGVDDAIALAVKARDASKEFRNLVAQKAADESWREDYIQLGDGETEHFQSFEDWLNYICVNSGIAGSPLVDGLRTLGTRVVPVVLSGNVRSTVDDIQKLPVVTSRRAFTAIKTVLADADRTGGAGDNHYKMIDTIIQKAAGPQVEFENWLLKAGLKTTRSNKPKLMVHVIEPECQDDFTANQMFLVCENPTTDIAEREEQGKLLEGFAKNCEDNQYAMSYSSGPRDLVLEILSSYCNPNDPTINAAIAILEMASNNPKLQQIISLLT